MLPRLANLAALLVMPFLVSGLVNRVKSLWSGRQGPRVFQLVYDVRRLLAKTPVYSHTTTPLFRIAPWVFLVTSLASAAVVPLLGAAPACSFRLDFVFLAYAWGLGRAALVLAALDTGSAFEGMGAAREVSYAVLAEAAIIAAVLSLSVQTGSVSLASMLSPSAGAGAVLLAAGLFTVLLAENCRVPFDDPNTHLELTMIHEVMVLDHSGPPLAAILHGASVKLLLFVLLLVQAVMPMAALSPMGAAGVLAAGVLAVTVGVGLVESLLARLAFRRVPLLLTTAFLLCLFALLVAWKGGAK